MMSYITHKARLTASKAQSKETLKALLNPVDLSSW